MRVVGRFIYLFMCIDAQPIIKSLDKVTAMEKQGDSKDFA